MASDADSDFQSAQFRFRNETTNNYIYLNDSDDDGIAFYKSSKSLENGTYNLNQIQLYDTESNRVEFYSSGSTGTWTSKGHESGTHTIDFSKFKFDVTGSTTIPKTDFTPPEFTSLAIDTSEVTAGDRFRLDYVASDLSLIHI